MELAAVLRLLLRAAEGYYYLAVGTAALMAAMTYRANARSK